MKKKKRIVIFVLLLLLILTVPVPAGQYTDGGTRDYKALTYRVVSWNRLLGEGETYRKTKVYPFPQNFKSIDELWALTYTKDAGDDAHKTEMDERSLRQKYPDYFDLPTGKGLEVYVWQMAPNSYSFGLLEGSNREKTIDELWDMKGASAEEMRAILSTYDIAESEVFVIPWQNPLSSYIGEYWLTDENEDADALAARRQAYIDTVREMLFPADGSGND